MCLIAWVALVGFVAGADDVTLSTSGPCYPPGVAVSFVLTNEGESPIDMPHFPVWDIVEDDTNEHVFPWVAFDMIVPLAAGSSATYQWMQGGRDGCQVADGAYRVVIRFRRRSGPWVLTSVSATFEIDENCPPVGVDRADWGKVKRRYRD